MSLALNASIPFVDRIRSAAASGMPLRIRGGGSKDFYAQALEGELLDTTALAGIVSYEPSELVVTAGAGTSLLELRRCLPPTASACRLSHRISPPPPPLAARWPAA